MQHDSSLNSLAGNDPLVSALWWSHPPADFSKLNVDGSYFLRSRMMGIGGFLPDSFCNWLWGFSGSVGQGNSLLAVLLALKQGLEIAWEKGHKRLIVETDSLEVIHLVNSPNNHNLYCGEVVKHIQQMLKKDGQIQCVDGVSVWHDPPLELAHDLALDKLA
ncbi:Ribonuclease H domain [Sesbania bispinosa]|nr:Ribonuclease H domain [Sesbania bispinosa]